MIDAGANGGGTITFDAAVSGTISLGSDLPHIADPVTITGPTSSAVTIDRERPPRLLRHRRRNGHDLEPDRHRLGLGSVLELERQQRSTSTTWSSPGTTRAATTVAAVSTVGQGRVRVVHPGRHQQPDHGEHDQRWWRRPVHRLLRHHHRQHRDLREPGAQRHRRWRSLRRRRHAAHRELDHREQLRQGQQRRRLPRRRDRGDHLELDHREQHDAQLDDPATGISVGGDASLDLIQSTVTGNHHVGAPGQRRLLRRSVHPGRQRVSPARSVDRRQRAVGPCRRALRRRRAPRSVPRRRRR